MDTIDNAWTRVRLSYETWTDAQQRRIAVGEQPYMPLTDFKSLAMLNAMYFLITWTLYGLMKKRQKPFPVRNIIMVYNVVCVALAGYVVVGMLVHFAKYGAPSFVCNEENFGEQGKELGFVFLVFYLQKFWEFMDTWFFLLRRSFRQVTFLHVFHHSSITLVVGLILPNAFSGDMYLPIFLNALVHVLMYSHYLVTALGVKAWWRPYLTSLQLIQFCLISTQSIMAWRSGPSCGAPDYGKMLLIWYMGSMLYLFGQFFIKSYIKKKQQ